MKTVQEFVDLLMSHGAAKTEVNGETVYAYGVKNSIVIFTFRPTAVRTLHVSRVQDYWMGRADVEFESVTAEVPASVEYWAGKSTSDSGGAAGSFCLTDREAKSKLKWLGRFLKSGNRSILH